MSDDNAWAYQQNNQSEIDKICKSQSQLFSKTLEWVLPKLCFSFKYEAENLSEDYKI